MIRRLLHIVVTTYLAVLLLFGTTSKEFVHLYTHHEDTVHTHQCVNKNEAHLDHAHHHCSFLSFTLEPFANDFQLPFLPARYLVHVAAYYAVTEVPMITAKASGYYLRGPPQA